MRSAQMTSPQCWIDRSGKRSLLPTIAGPWLPLDVGHQGVEPVRQRDRVVIQKDEEAALRCPAPSLQETANPRFCSCRTTRIAAP